MATAGLSVHLSIELVHRPGGGEWSLTEAVHPTPSRRSVADRDRAHLVTRVDGVPVFLLGGSTLLAGFLGYVGCDVLALADLVLRPRNAVRCPVHSLVHPRGTAAGADAEQGAHLADPLWRPRNRASGGATHQWR
jgi:surfactin synthase thioesterase subunit